MSRNELVEQEVLIGVLVWAQSSFVLRHADFRLSRPSPLKNDKVPQANRLGTLSFYVGVEGLEPPA